MSSENRQCGGKQHFPVDVAINDVAAKYQYKNTILGSHGIADAAALNGYLRDVQAHASNETISGMTGIDIDWKSYYLRMPVSSP
jgi:hypothetical protein